MTHNSHCVNLEGHMPAILTEANAGVGKDTPPYGLNRLFFHVGAGLSPPAGL